MKGDGIIVERVRTEDLIGLVGMRDILQGLFLVPLRNNSDEFLLIRGLVGERKALDYFQNNNTSLLIDEIGERINNMSTKQLQIFNGHLLTARNVRVVQETGIPINLTKLERECQKMYLDGKITMNYTRLRESIKIVEGTPRLFCSWNPYATVTGRIQSYQPNVQGLPRIVRDEVFEAKDGYVLVFADYNSEELAIIGALANDKSLLKRIREGHDLHREMSSILYRKNVDDITDEERQLTKKLTFASLYGAGTESLGKMASVYSINRIKGSRIKDTILSFYPAIDILKNRILDAGEIEFIDGSIVPLQSITKKYSCLNRLVQGTGAILLKSGINQLIKNLPNARIVCLLHDEIVLEVAESVIDKSLPIINGIMSNIFKQYDIDAVMPLSIDIRRN